MIEYHDVQPSTHTYVTITSTTPMLPLAYLEQNMIFDHAIFAYIQIYCILYPLLFDTISNITCSQLRSSHICSVWSKHRESVPYLSNAKLRSWPEISNKTNFEKLRINSNKNTKYSKFLVIHYICQLNYQYIFLVLCDTSPQQKCTSVLRVKNITLYKYRRNKEFFRNVMLFNILRVKHAAWQ